MFDNLSEIEQEKILKRVDKVPAIESKVDTILILVGAEFIGVMALLLTMFNYLLT